MTLAIAGLTSTEPTALRTVPIAIIGTDALLAALPATPVQLAHACLRAGFANVIPASWGDELIAAAVLRRLSDFGTGPAIHCSCPIVAHRLLSAGGDLRPVMVTHVSPPVAVARYLQSLSQHTRMRVTYAGNCPGAIDSTIDIRMTPEALLALLAEREIRLEDQPRVFESIIPPDRRRFWSQPGGLPTADSLWNQLGSRGLVEVYGDDFAAELAQHLLSDKNVLIDVSARLGCACSGAVGGVTPTEARMHIVALEPPRSTLPVIEDGAPIELDSPVPAASRNPIDVAAVPASGLASQRITPAGPGQMPLGHRISPVRGISVAMEHSPARISNPSVSRSVHGSLPLSRDTEGKALPRAYIARRRSSPRGIAVIGIEPEEALPEARPRASAASREMAQSESPAPASASTALVLSIQPRRLVYLVAMALVLIIGVSAVVAVVTGRSISASSSGTPHQR